MLTQKSTATLLDLTYTRNAKGLITATASPDTTRTWTYTFDGIDLLGILLALRLPGARERRHPAVGAHVAQGNKIGVHLPRRAPLLARLTLASKSRHHSW